MDKISVIDRKVVHALVLRDEQWDKKIKDCRERITEYLQEEEGGDYEYLTEPIMMIFDEVFESKKKSKETERKGGNERLLSVGMCDLLKSGLGGW